MPSHYGVDSVIEKTENGETITDTVFHMMQDNQFVTHLNRSVNLAKDYKGQMLIINFIDTRDTVRGNKLSDYMGHIQKGFKLKKTDSAIQLITFSLNPYENLQSLRTYADQFTHDHDSWHFLIGTKDSIKRFAENELFLTDFADSSNSSTLEKLVLVDKYRNIRGYYDTKDSMQVKYCIDDIAFMMVEKNKIHERKKR